MGKFSKANLIWLKKLIKSCLKKEIPKQPDLASLKLSNNTESPNIDNQNQSLSTKRKKKKVSVLLHEQIVRYIMALI